MKLDLFTLLTLIVIIILVLTSDNVIIALITIALMANFALLYREFTKEKISGGSDGSIIDGISDLSNNEEPIFDETDLEQFAEDRGSDYGRSQDLYDTYVNTYGDSYGTNSPIAINSASERDYSVDNASVDMSIRRFRDKKSADGRVVKDADFYKHHFANELEEEARKEWWGNGEW